MSDNYTDWQHEWAEDNLTDLLSEWQDHQCLGDSCACIDTLQVRIEEAAGYLGEVGLMMCADADYPLPEIKFEWEIL